MPQNPIAPDLSFVKDVQTATPGGELVGRRIEGVVHIRLPLLEDHRGSILEMYRPSWLVHDAPLVYVYEAQVRPGLVKGWVVHREQDDRIVHSRGTLWWALYDARPESPTAGLVNELVLSEQSRSLLIIPMGVVHAVKNIGTDVAAFINMPTAPYDHANPDKYRMPMDGHAIPFTFDDRVRHGPAKPTT